MMTNHPEAPCIIRCFRRNFPNIEEKLNIDVDFDDDKPPAAPECPPLKFEGSGSTWDNFPPSMDIHGALYVHSWDCAVCTAGNVQCTVCILCALCTVHCTYYTRTPLHRSQQMHISDNFLILVAPTLCRCTLYLCALSLFRALQSNRIHREPQRGMKEGENLAN